MRKTWISDKNKIHRQNVFFYLEVTVHRMNWFISHVLWIRTRFNQNRGPENHVFVIDVWSPIQTGAGPGFFIFRGALKIMCVHAHYEREARRPLRPGSRALKWALEALGFFFYYYSLSCYLSFIFKHSDTKWDLKNIYSIKMLGVRALVRHCQTAKEFLWLCL